LVAGGLVFALGACGPASQVDRAAEVDVRARVLDPGGTPAAGVPVVLTPESNVGGFFGGFFFAPFTIFTTSLVDPQPEFCRGGFSVGREASRVAWIAVTAAALGLTAGTAITVAVLRRRSGTP
jgi:hypothetical protein